MSTSAMCVCVCADWNRTGADTRWHLCARTVAAAASAAVLCRSARWTLAAFTRPKRDLLRAIVAADCRQRATSFMCWRVWTAATNRVSGQGDRSGNDGAVGVAVESGGETSAR
uniref:Secreted protein n=1 Tax=Plectus sambesii TaxID=2011161 RepID=A0A914XIY0_9BILA